MTLKAKLNLVSAILSVVAVVIGVIGINGIRQTNAGLETVYKDRVVPLEQLKAIADDYAVAIIDAANKANAGIFTAEETLKGVEVASANITKNWKSYRATYLTAEETKLANEADALFVPADAAVEKLRQHLTIYDTYMQKLGGSMSTTVNHFNNAYKEFKKVDKDIIKITGLEASIENIEVEKPLLDNE